MPRGTELRYFHTRVVGVTYANADGTRRQAIIPHCNAGDIVRLVPEPTNPQDPNALMVCRENGDHIGYIGADLAHEIRERSERGWQYAAFIEDVDGGTERAATYGVLLAIAVGRSDVDRGRFDAYVDKLRAPLSRQRKRPFGSCLLVVIVVLILIWLLL